jgi:2-aminobenzoate-CoA ligase
MDDMNEVPRGEVGRLAVRGPTGCRYSQRSGAAAEICPRRLEPDRRILHQDEDGFFHFAARSDDMIISAGYNIAGPEVEAALLAHGDVAECAVIGVADEARGQIVQAHVVLNSGVAADEVTTKRLQDHVKAVIAPYKYPRSVIFTDALPKTQTGKIQRFRLRTGDA